MSAPDVSHDLVGSPTDRTAPQVSARGTNGTITLDGDQVRVHKGLGTLRHGARGERRIPLRRIVAVRMEPATDHSEGHLALLLEGEDPALHDQLATTGEHTIRFRPAAAAAFDEVRTRLESRLQAQTAAAR